MTAGSNRTEVPVYLWRERYTVKSYDVDLKKRMSLTSLLGCLLESAWQHARRCGFGYGDLAEKGQFWVLSMLHIEIARPPLWREPIVIETWSKGTNGLFALRDFLVSDKEDAAVVRATSGWLILDR
jgi:medium-chain acyl-[acyl-carrier-protein] hydrolase